MAPERPGGEEEPVPVSLSVNNSVAIPITLLSIPNTVLHIKEGDGASEDRSEKGSEDDDLTSLTWLQDKNLLKGINLRTSGGGVQESPTSDYIDDSASERDSTCSSGNTCPSPPPPLTTPLNPSAALASSKTKHPNHIPYDPKVHTASKPPYSFSCLIFMAIEDSPAKALPVKEIYNWILEHFPFYKNAPTGWKNSVRHNLSLNKCFRKVDKAPNLGKGSLWMVDPLYRSNLMQTLQKAPYHPCASLRKIPQPSQAQKPVAATKVNGSARLPDPELFPYLSRRLAAAENNDPLDDVHAAAAMLQLKHGPSIAGLQRKEEYQRRFGEQLLQAARGVKRKIKAELENTMLITSSPSEDHTYSSAEPSVVKNEPASPDEAFADGSDSDSSWVMPVKVEVDTDIEEQRKIAEGADALLNLAGITTCQTSSPAAKSPFRPRMLRKSSPTKQRRSDNNTETKTRWKLTVESNNNVERAECEPRPPAKIRRKLASGANKSANKMKR